MAFYWLGDAVPSTVGLVEATPTQSIEQDVLHLIINLQYNKMVMTPANLTAAQNNISGALQNNQYVNNVDFVALVPNHANNTLVANVSVNHGAIVTKVSA